MKTIRMITFSPTHKIQIKDNNHRFFLNLPPPAFPHTTQTKILSTIIKKIRIMIIRWKKTLLPTQNTNRNTNNNRTLLPKQSTGRITSSASTRTARRRRTTRSTRRSARGGRSWPARTRNSRPSCSLSPMLLWPSGTPSGKSGGEGCWRGQRRREGEGGMLGEGYAFR